MLRRSNKTLIRSCTFLVLMTLLSMAIPGHAHRGYEPGRRVGISPMDISGGGSPSAHHRSGNRLAEDFSTIEHIDMSNTTVIIDTLGGRVRLRGMGNPRSNIRDVTNADHTVGHSGFNSMAVDENGRYYHLDAGSGTTVYIFSDWTDYFQSRQHADTLLVPESQHSTQMFVANGHLYTSSESSDNLRKVRLADKAIVQSNIRHARTSNWGWRGVRQQGVACDGTYIYTWCDTTLKIWDLNENLLRTVNGLPNKQGYSTCFAVGHFFYCVQYSQARISHRVDADSGTVHQYTNEVFISNSYVVDASYDYFHNRLFTGLGWQNTYALDNVARVWGDQEGFTNGTIQSKSLSDAPHSIGSARVGYFEDTPADTRIIYNITNDGENWVRVKNNTEIFFDQLASDLRWNASLYTNSTSVTPGIKSLDIRWNFVDAPAPSAPSEEVWQGDFTPVLSWEFRDPDEGDGQSHYRVEVYGDRGLADMIYDSDWINSSDGLHEVGCNLSDGIYHWRVSTKDCRHAAGNFSGARILMIDVTGPLGSILIEEGAETVNDKLVGLFINGTDNGSGIVEMRIINERGTVGPWEEYANEKAIALEEVDGLKTIGVQFRDDAGIVSETFNDTIYLDLEGPGNMKVGSPTHSDPERYYNNTEPVFQWEPPGDVAGIKGYSYTYDDRPDSVPTKILYTSNGDITGTRPEDFPGLGEGSWYFHITPCDIYDQWGNTTHFRFNIDTIHPRMVETGPPEGSWFNTTAVSVNAVFSELGGSGLDVDSVQFSVALGGGVFGVWESDGIETEVVERDPSDNPVKVSVKTVAELSEGAGNRVRWRCADLAGNEFVSPATVIKVDITPVTFGSPVPSEDETFTETSVICGITVSDCGSGVDGRSIEYCRSFYGDHSSLFVNWTPAGSSLMKDEIEVLLELEFEPGRDNYVKWRAGDIAGNGMSYSKPVRLSINSAPVPCIGSPLDDSENEGGVPVRLSANGSLDPDGDELAFYWEVRNASTKNVVFGANGRNVETSILAEGAYRVILWVDDGSGQNISTKIDMTVLAVRDTGGGGMGGGTNEDIPELGPSGGFPLIPILIICAVVFILTLIGILIAVRRKKRNKKGKAVPTAASECQGHPYPRGEYSPSGHPGYVPDQQYRAFPPHHGAAGEVRPTGQTPSPSGMQQPPPRMPPWDAGGLNRNGALGPMQRTARLPCSLPPVQTDPGTQYRNIPALPPAPASLPSLPLITDAAQIQSVSGVQPPAPASLASLPPVPGVAQASPLSEIRTSPFVEDAGPAGGTPEAGSDPLA